MATIKELLDQQLAINDQILKKDRLNVRESIKANIDNDKLIDDIAAKATPKKKRGRPAKNGTTKATSTGQS